MIDAWLLGDIRVPLHYQFHMELPRGKPGDTEKEWVYYTQFTCLVATYMETERNGGYIHLLSVSFLLETTQNFDN
jgi:hypothetical protein